MSAKMAHVWSQIIHHYPMIRLNQRWSWQDDRAGRKGRRPRPSDEYHAESLHQGWILQDLPWFWWWIHIPSHSKGNYGSTSSTHKKWRIHCDFFSHFSRCEVDAGVTPLLTPKKELVVGGFNRWSVAFVGGCSEGQPAKGHHRSPDQSLYGLVSDRGRCGEIRRWRGFAGEDLLT